MTKACLKTKKPETNRSETDCKAAPVRRSYLHRVWDSMKTRCTNPRSGNYKNYGGRGIKICDRWLHSFEAFAEDMGPRPSAAHSLDRIDVDGDYEPKNCRWATWKQQGRNRRTNVFVTIGNETKCLAEWAEESGIEYATVTKRIREGWEPALAVFTPARPMAKHTVAPRLIEFNGQSKNLSEWSRELGISRSVLSRRAQKGWPPEKILFFPVREKLQNHRFKKSADT